MNERTIEIEAESLEEARKQLQAQIPEGLHLLSEDVISDESPKTVQAVASTTEAAFAKAHGEIPNNAEVLERKGLRDAERKVITVDAFDEQAARLSAEHQATSQFGSDAVVDSLKLAVTGSKGLLGIGKKPNQYQAEILQPALVEITCRTKAKISAKIGVNVEALIADLTNIDENTRNASIEALVGIGVSAVEPLIATLSRDKDVDVRQAAAGVLGKIGVPAVEPLVAALKSLAEVVQRAEARQTTQGPHIYHDALGLPPPDLSSLVKWNAEKTRWAVVQALEEIGVPAVEALIAALKDVEPFVRVAATTALARIRDPRAVEPLIAALKDTNGDVRTGAAGALAALRDPRAVGPLIAALQERTDSPDAITRKLLCATALKAITGQNIGSDDAAWEQWWREQTGETAERIEPKAEQLIQSLSNSDPVRRYEAAKALGEMGDGRAVDPLVFTLKDSDAGVRRAAAIALGQIGDERALDPLSFAGFNDDDEQVRRAALEAMMLCAGYPP